MTLFNSKFNVRLFRSGSSAISMSAPVKKITPKVFKCLTLLSMIILMSACGGNSGSPATEGSQGGAGAENNNGSGVMDTASVPTNNNGNGQDSAGFSNPTYDSQTGGTQGGGTTGSGSTNNGSGNNGNKTNTPQGNAKPSGRMNNNTGAQ